MELQARLVISFLLMVWFSGFTQKSVLLLNGTAHLGTGEVINTSVIGIRNGKLELVANALITKYDESLYDTVIRIDGKHVYPGFIAPNSTLGLVEIDAVRATADFAEVGDYHPHVRSAIAYNTDSEVIATVRSNGVLVAQVTPRSGTISGTSSIMSLWGRNWEDAVVTQDDGIHVNWPGLFVRHHWGEDGGVQRNPVYEKQVRALKVFLQQAKVYQPGNDGKTDQALAAMTPVFTGTKKLFVHCDFAREIEDVVALKKDLELPSVVLVGGHDAWMLPDMLKENKIAVVLHRVHSLPFREEEDVDLPYRLPALLEERGILFCLENSGDMEAMNSRNLPFYAGTAAAYGLDKEKALMAITLNAARILGLEKRLGSLEVGKDATLFVSAGDALDMRTNHVTHAWVSGEAVDLDNHQKALYRKYVKMYSVKPGKE
jgi:imidazolonepropionase-like amidohydrolase